MVSYTLTFHVEATKTSEEERAIKLAHELALNLPGQVLYARITGDNVGVRDVFELPERMSI